MRQIVLITLGVIAAIALVIGFFTFTQAEGERTNLSADLQYRTHSLADSLEASIEPSFIAGATTTVQRIVDRITDKEHVVGLWVFDSFGQLSAYSGDLQGISGSALARSAMDADASSGNFTYAGDESVFAFVQPMHQGTRVVGALMIVQSAGYIDAAVQKIWIDSLVRFLIQVFLIGAAIFILVRFVFFRSLSRLVASMRSARRGDGEDTEPGPGFLKPVTAEISKMTSSLKEARLAASEEARMRLEKLDSPWTAERLKEFVKAYLKNRQVFIVTNREPYVHRKERGKVSCSVPAGGPVTALEPVMEACGGMWIAHGSGNADKETADQEGKLRVPPEEPSYTLKRVWLSEREVKGYYDGFSNEALWPLCHMAHVRPLFRVEDWKQYRKVNGLFAKTILDEIRHVEQPIVLVQDYHLALVPALVKKSRPDAHVALFWHIPWPSAAQFSICPWRKEILEGMLGADLVGFHIQQYCNNFIETVGAEIEARIDYEHFSVVRSDHASFVKPFPISIAFPGAAEPKGEPDRSALERLGIDGVRLALGVDRLDYIKGILERFKAVEFLLDTHPEYRGAFTLLQISSPTRQGVEKYRQYAAQVVEEAERINKRFAHGSWRPIVLEHRHYSHAELLPLYQLADVCLVTSVHDGMNLVAKEFIAARIEDDGVLILSHFTGASRDLKGALVVNPYSAEEASAAIAQALVMPKTEQHRRMKALRESVRDYNVYRWSAEILKALTTIG